MSNTVTRIQLVEDDESHVELIRRAFESTSGNARIVVAHTLREAQDSLVESSPDLLITDLRLPDGEGTELLQSEKGELPYPVIIITGQGDEQAVVKAMKAGALDYVIKSKETMSDMPHIADRALREWNHLIKQKQIEEQLRIANEHLRELTSELLIIEEGERHRIASVLHNLINKSLVLANSKLQRLCVSASNDMSEKLTEICNIVNDVIKDSRSLIYDMSSPVLEELGLQAAIENLLTELFSKKSGVITEFCDYDSFIPLDKNIKLMLFRCVRELLFNVIKHADADFVKVVVEKPNDKIKIAVEDNGEGFDVDEVKTACSREGKYGLFSIFEHLGYFGGMLEIDSAFGSGTCVTITSPVSCHKKDEVECN